MKTKCERFHRLKAPLYMMDNEQIDVNNTSKYEQIDTDALLDFITFNMITFAIMSVFAVMSNVLIIIGYFLVNNKRAHHSELFILWLAVFDFLVGSLGGPAIESVLYNKKILYDPKRNDLIFSLYTKNWRVVQDYVMKLFSFPCALSFYLIIFMLIDRSMATNFPFWYASKIDKSIIIKVIIILLSLCLVISVIELSVLCWLAWSVSGFAWSVSGPG